MSNSKNQQLSNTKPNSERKPYGPVSEFYQFPLALLEIMEMASSLKPGTFHEAVKNNLSDIKLIAESMLNLISGRPGELSALSRQTGNVTAGVFAAADHLNLIVKRQLDYLTIAGVMGTHGFVNTLEILILEYRLWQKATQSNHGAAGDLWQAVLDKHSWPPEILKKLEWDGIEERAIMSEEKA